MKQASLRIISILLICILSIQATTPDNYFTRFKRGINCLIARKPCAQEDIKTVYQVGTILLILTGFAVLVYTKGTALTPEDREILALPIEQQQEAKNAKLADAIENHDLSGVQHWLAFGANPNSYGTSGTHMLRLAISQFSQAWERHVASDRNKAENIVLTLINHGADSNMRATLYSKKGYAIRDVASPYATSKMKKAYGFRNYWVDE